MKTDLETIDGAIELISRDGGWCQGSFCRDAQGHGGLSMLSELGLPPVSFCIEGAIIEVASGGWFTNEVGSGTHSEDEYAAYQYGFALASRVGQMMGLDHGDKPRSFNDAETTSQEDAILFLKHAREILAAQPRKETL